ncbi:MAG: HAMP domain-containing histidine kinase [Prosthecobacter sp.]|jgi:signal transduction histidine kinase|uniref:HAMP domain-containing sensor histidine kinase n=1 Tax=Prosthecobacter sp. TaxID=1965333 RepID=UPI001A03095E|nr:HAMP domain-containing sensor histidine kinase [Prosthecobacter sp.]MBE2286993.1 HAMP domain-containing histidine kinase [Prosthecobacter sp.]
MFSKLFPERLSSIWRLGLLLTILLVCSTALCISVAGWTMKQNLSTIARAVVLDDLGEYAVLYNRNGLKEIKDVFAAGGHENDQAVRITQPDGTVLFEQIPRAVEGYRWPAKTPKKLKLSETLLMTIQHAGKEQELLAGCQVLNDGNLLWFGRTDAEDRAYVEHIRGHLRLAGLVSAAFMLLPLWWFVRHVLRPVQEMMSSTRRLAEGSTDARLQAPGAVPELQAFAKAFNHGLDRIDALTSELQNANDNLAHELRTPLARIRGNLETFHDHTDNETARDAAARGLEEIDRAVELVQTILTTRAGEHKALKLHLEILDLRELLTDLHDLYKAAADERGLTFALEASESRWALLDRQRINQAVANLLDNAFAYTPRGGTVRLVLAVRDDQARISVIDTGPGLTAADLDKIWQRYVRGSAATANTPGMGLGLSLVRALAHAHNGNTGCRNRDEGGAEFWIELPAGDPLASANGV